VSDNEALQRFGAHNKGRDSAQAPSVFLFSTYVIGKEKILRAVAEQLGVTVITDMPSLPWSLFVVAPSPLFSSSSCR
jgi:hypothetical protein